MSFKRGGAHKRRDALEPAIRQALHAAGVQTWQLHGTGLPDLLLWMPRTDRYWALEIKTEGGRLTAAQRDVPWPVVNTIHDALAVVGIRL